MYIYIYIYIWRVQFNPDHVRDVKLFPSVFLRFPFGYAGEMKAMSVKKTEENIPNFMDPSVPLRLC